MFSTRGTFEVKVIWYLALFFVQITSISLEIVQDKLSSVANKSCGRIQFLVYFSDCLWAQRSTASSGERSSSQWIKMWWGPTAVTISSEGRTTPTWRSWGVYTLLILIFHSFSLLSPQSILIIPIPEHQHAGTGTPIHFIFRALRGSCKWVSCVIDSD